MEGKRRGRFCALGGGTLPDVKSQLLDNSCWWSGRGLQPQLRKCCPLTAARQKQKPTATERESMVKQAASKIAKATGYASKQKHNRQQTAVAIIDIQPAEEDLDKYL